MPPSKFICRRCDERLEQLHNDYWVTIEQKRAQCRKAPVDDPYHVPAVFIPLEEQEMEQEAI